MAACTLPLTPRAQPARIGFADVDLVDVLASLCAIPAPSGVEGELADHLRQRWSGRCAEVRRDGVGNVVARVGGAGPRVLVQAHMDQVGYLVRHVTDDGFL